MAVMAKGAISGSTTTCSQSHKAGCWLSTVGLQGQPGYVG